MTMNDRIDQLTPWIAGLAIAAGGVLFACNEDAGGTPGTGGGDAGSGASTSTDAATSPASQAVVTTASTSTGMNTFDCNPPAEPGSIFELEDNEVFPPFNTRSMCEFRGDVMLIFNAAAL